MLKVGISPQDFATINKNLDKLSGPQIFAVMKAAVRQGANVVKKAALAKTPKGNTGNLRKGLASKENRVGPLGIEFNVGWKKPEAAHGHLIEAGHRIFRPTRDGGAVDTGRMTAPNPILRPAFLNNRDKVLEIVKDRLSVDNIVKFLAKSAKRRPRFK